MSRLIEGSLKIADCKFAHPPSRPTPRGAKAPFRKSAHGFGGTGMNVSKKFGPVAGTEKKLDPSAGEFKPASETTAGA